MWAITIQTAVLATTLVGQYIPNFEFFEIKKFVGYHALTVALLAAEILIFCLASFRIHHFKLQILGEDTR